MDYPSDLVACSKAQCLKGVKILTSINTRIKATRDEILRLV